MAGLVADRLDRVAVSFREKPKVARLVIVDLARARRSERDRLTLPGNDERPFACTCMPVEFTRGARVQEHVNARHRLADRKEVRGNLLRPTAR